MNKIVIIVLGIIISFGVNAQKVLNSEFALIQKKFEKEFKIKDKPISLISILSNNDTLGIIVNYPHSFIVISTKKELPPIKAYSLKNSFPHNPDIKSDFSFKSMIKDDFISIISSNNNSQTLAKLNQSAWEAALKENGILNTKVDYGPWLKSIFGQVNCKDENNNYINVTNLYTPNNYAVGCVAIVFTELLHYYNWPIRGEGSHTYSDTYGNSTGTYTVNYESDNYHWSKILDEYYKKPSNQSQRAELGNLAYHCAVAVDMDFESNGSTSNVNRIPAAANKYFRFTADFITKSSSTFWDRITQNIINGYPVGVSIYTTSGAGHAVVIDGYRDQSSSQKYYHLNMGWWGSANAWYNTQGSFNAGGYSDIPSAVVDMFPVPEMAKPILNTTNNTVTVEWYYPANANPDAFELMVNEGNNWVSIADNITQTKYSYSYTSTSIHDFRVRAKVMGKWNNTGWSNHESIDIKHELEIINNIEFRIAPTIGTDILTVESSNLRGSLISIYDATGRCVIMNKIEESDGSTKKYINIQELNSGIYFIKLSGEGIKESAKFIKI